MGRVVAVVTGGFLLGSAFTMVIGWYFYSEQRRRTEKKADDEPDDNLRFAPTSNQKFRSAYQEAASNDTECAGFLSEIVKQLWSHLSVASSNMIVEMVEPMFATSMPKPLKSLHFTNCSLGEIPVRLDNVLVHQEMNNVLQFDVDVIWDGDCDIQLHANYVGSFGVKSVQLKGRMSFLLRPLTNELPVVAAIQYAFINTPELELDFTGLAQIADFKVIDKSIRKTIQEILAEMIVLPNRMLCNMDTTTPFFDIYQPPIGIARLTLVQGRGFQIEKRRLRKADIPDVYCNVTLAGREWKTCTIPNSLEPQWNETADFLLSDHNQVINVHAWDEDSGTFEADDHLGTAECTVGELLSTRDTTKELELRHEHKRTGGFITLACKVCSLTRDLSSLQARAKTPATRNQWSGLLTILVSQAFHLPVTRQEANSYVKVTYGSKEFVTSAMIDDEGVDALNPLYESAFTVPITGDDTGQVTVVLSLWNGTDCLGTIGIPHSEVIDAVDRTLTDKRLIGSQGAMLEFRVILQGIKSHHSKYYRTP